MNMLRPLRYVKSSSGEAEALETLSEKLVEDLRVHIQNLVRVVERRYIDFMSSHFSLTRDSSMILTSWPKIGLKWPQASTESRPWVKA